MWEAVVCVFSYYYQHDYLQVLSVFLSETCARVLREISGIRVQCETEYSAGWSGTEAVVKKEKF